MLRNSSSSPLRSLSAFAILLWLAACGSTPTDHTMAANDSNPAEGDSFEMASAVQESELSDMRGGFQVAGGYTIDFGLTSTTMVNGVIANNFNIHSLNNVSSQDLQQVLQVGESNGFNPTTPATLGNSVLTVVQNTTNNSSIQNKNVLNLTLSNLGNLRTQTTLLHSFGPMVRALH